MGKSFGWIPSRLQGELKKVSLGFYSCCVINATHVKKQWQFDAEYFVIVLSIICF